MSFVQAKVNFQVRLVSKSIYLLSLFCGRAAKMCFDAAKPHVQKQLRHSRNKKTTPKYTFQIILNEFSNDKVLEGLRQEKEEEKRKNLSVFTANNSKVGEVLGPQVKSHALVVEEADLRKGSSVFDISTNCHRV